MPIIGRLIGGLRGLFRKRQVERELDEELRAYLEAAVLQGRAFDEHDTPGSPRVVVVNEAFVHRYLPNGNPIGIRMALGADRGMVIAMVLREGLFQGVVGILIGIPAALAATQLVANQLYGVSPTDPQHSATAALVLILCSAIAGYVPARRAAGIDPNVALRCE